MKIFKTSINLKFNLFLFSFSKSKIDLWKEDTTKLNYLVQLIITFLNRSDCYLVDDLEVVLNVSF
jgi:hypothetical protein